MFLSRMLLRGDSEESVSVPCRGLTCFYVIIDQIFEIIDKVSVPCRGLTCFYRPATMEEIVRRCFRPLSGSYMFLCYIDCYFNGREMVSVPCRGLTCFYKPRQGQRTNIAFPSPVGVLHVSINAQILQP